MNILRGCQLILGLGSKGQLSSKGLFVFFNSPKKQTKNFCPSRLGQKLTLSSSFFWRIEGIKISFWDKLTFSSWPDGSKIKSFPTLRNELELQDPATMLILKIKVYFCWHVYNTYFFEVIIGPWYLLFPQGPSIYYFSTFLDLFWPIHPLCQQKYKTKRHQKWTFSEPTQSLCWRN